MGAQTYVVGGLRDVAESWRGELWDDLLNLDVFGRHDGGMRDGIMGRSKVFVLQTCAGAGAGKHLSAAGMALVGG